MKIKFYSLSVLVICLLAGCQNKHFISDSDYRRTVNADFEQKKEQFTYDNFFAFIDVDSLSSYVKEAMKFFYAYRPIGVITDYPADYYLRNFRLSEQTRNEMPWGKEIPEEIYRHFVLPIRINNENLDEARSVFYGELKDRVKHLSMKE